MQTKLCCGLLRGQPPTANNLVQYVVPTHGRRGTSASHTTNWNQIVCVAYETSLSLGLSGPLEGTPDGVVQRLENIVAWRQVPCHRLEILDTLRNGGQSLHTAQLQAVCDSGLELSRGRQQNVLPSKRKDSRLLCAVRVRQTVELCELFNRLGGTAQTRPRRVTWALHNKNGCARPRAKNNPGEGSRTRRKGKDEGEGGRKRSMHEEMR